jgi:acetyl esterase
MMTGVSSEPNALGPWPDELHADAAALLDTFAADGVRPYDELGVLTARSMVAGSTRLQGERTAVERVEEVLVEHGSVAVPARLYNPRPDATPPIVCYFHGGGFVTGSVAVADRACRALAAASGWAVLSLEYRLAPENPYPAALEDCVAAVRWVRDHATGLGVDGTRVVVLGDSAGGALATAAATVLRGTDYAPVGQVLVYPTLAPVRGRRSPSIDDYGELLSLTEGSVDWFWSHYLRAGQERDPLAVPLEQTGLAGLPPATVVVAGCDLLRDEGLDYARRLAGAGVPVTTHVVAGAIHGFWWMDRVLSQAAELTALLAAELARYGKRATST